MSVTSNKLLSQAKEGLTDRLMYRSNGRKPVITDEPSIEGQRIIAPIREDITLAKLQGLAPPWVSVADFSPGIAHFELHEDNARMALQN